MADVASKQQKTTLLLPTMVTRTRRHSEVTKKTDKPDGKTVLCHRIFSSVFRAVFYTFKLHSLTYGVWGLETSCCMQYEEYSTQHRNMRIICQLYIHL